MNLRRLFDIGENPRLSNKFLHNNLKLKNDGVADSLRACRSASSLLLAKETFRLFEPAPGFKTTGKSFGMKNCLYSSYVPKDWDESFWDTLSPTTSRNTSMKTLL